MLIDQCNAIDNAEKKNPSDISEGVKSDFHGYIYKMKWTDLWKWTYRVHLTIKRWTW